MNVGSEFYSWSINRLFPVQELKNCDVTTVVCKLKRYEKDVYEILRCKNKSIRAKYDFVPIETH